MNDLNIPNYRIETRLRQWDAEGRVYLAQHQSQLHWVELYVIPPRVSQFTDFAPSYKKLISSKPSTHPHILTVYELGVKDSWYYFALEYFQGKSLQQWLSEQKQFRLSDALQASLQLISAVQALTPHLDTPPKLSQEEIFINSDGLLKTHPSTLLTVPKPLQSTHYAGNPDSKFRVDPLSMNPEILENAKLLSERSIIFSIGQLLYRMISGQWPFPTKSLRALCFALEKGCETPLRTEQSGSKALSELVSQCLEVNPKQRPQSLAKLASALSAFC
ncbi:MAG: protein kinase [Planctomycetota bacterium]|nr:protein kinase [Planctomycetota bacterium]